MRDLIKLWANCVCVTVCYSLCVFFGASDERPGTWLPLCAMVSFSLRDAVMCSGSVFGLAPFPCIILMCLCLYFIIPHISKTTHCGAARVSLFIVDVALSS